ncbi:hypothetical protein YC2023_013471 [Brassica napus]
MEQEVVNKFTNHTGLSPLQRSNGSLPSPCDCFCYHLYAFRQKNLFFCLWKVQSPRKQNNCFFSQVNFAS